MALFKIAKGSASNLSTSTISKKPIEGYCWFTTDDGRFYIDTSTSTNNAVIGTNRIAINGVHTASNSWTAGSSAGPTLSITINDITSTAAAIPSASATASGIVTTGNQTFAGRKTMNLISPSIYDGTGDTSRYRRIYFKNNSDTTVGNIRYDSGNATNVTAGQFTFFEYSPKETPDTGNNGHTEAYSLPNVTSGLTTDKSYKIITTKNPEDLGYYLPLSGGTMTGSLTLSGSAGIQYQGTKNTYRMIRFIDNTNDTYGNGISIGGGGQTIIGGGESADTAAAQAGTAGAEIMQVCNDGDVQIISNLQDGWNNRKVSTFNTTGNLTLPAKLVCANVGNTTGGSYTESGLEIREYNYGSDQSDTWGNAPRMTFHWGNRVEAQIGLASNGWLYTTSGYGGNLTTNPHRFVIEQGGTWNISVSGNAATATSSQAVLSGGTIGSYSTSHATALKNWFDSYKASTPRNQLIAFYDVSGGNGSLAFGYFLSGYDSNPYGGFYCAHYNTPYYIGISSGTYTQSQIWKQGDAVTGAVWNDYAEYREATPDSTTPGYVVFENGDDTLSLTTERLQHFAGITSDTWGFAQGETEKAKTPIAVSGRVLAYTYRDRNEYKPGDCVCAAPGGTIDIMTREEIREWPDRIVGTVSCVPEYDEWGGGELADRPSVKVNGRIWIKVR